MMSMFFYNIKHNPRKENGNTDYLSRYHFEEPRGSDEDDVAPICHASATPEPKKIGIVELSRERSKIGN